MLALPSTAILFIRPFCQRHPCENGSVSSPEQPNQPELPDPSAQIAQSSGHAAQSAQHAAEPVETVVDERTVIVRRAPRYFNFMLLGAVVGALAAFILTVSFPENPQFGRLQVFGYLLLALVAIGVGLGCLVAIILDRFVGRTGAEAVADRLDGHAAGVVPGTASAAAEPAAQSAARPAAKPAAEPAAGPTATQSAAAPSAPLADDGIGSATPNSHDSGTKPE
jgi:hypothetical protein